MSLYDYDIPPGKADTFFQYVYDAQGQSLVNGQTYLQQGIQVLDGQFIARYWSGLNTIASTLQIYDWLKRQFASAPMSLGAGNLGGVYGQMAVLPEVPYPDSGAIRFDLGNVTQTSQGTDTGTAILASQLVFSGVRRRNTGVSDPMPSNYKYYEKNFSYPVTLSINNYATTGGVFNPPVQYTIPVNDFDFELRRVELALQSDQQTSQFKIQMYNSDWRQLSNLPVLSNLFCHTNTERNSGELAFFPSPPVLYRVNSVIRYDIYSLLVSPTALPQAFQLNFVGVRRIPC